MATASDRTRETTLPSRWLARTLQIAALSAAAAVVHVGCEERAPARPAARESGGADVPGQVPRVVREVVESMHAHDCARLERLIDGALRARLSSRGGCARVVETEPESMDLELVRMDTPRRDGRDRNAWIVPVVLRGETAEQSLLMRVQQRAGQYRVVSM